MLCDVGAEYIHRTRHARLARTDIAAPGRIGWCAWEGERAREDAMTIAAERRRWPAEGLTRVPYWVYSDRDVYEEEQTRIFRGPTWHFLCLEAELPNPDNYCRSSLSRAWCSARLRRTRRRSSAISDPRSSRASAA